MVLKRVSQLVLGGLLTIAVIGIPACQSSGGSEPQALTGRSEPQALTGRTEQSGIRRVGVKPGHPGGSLREPGASQRSSR